MTPEEQKQFDAWKEHVKRRGKEESAWLVDSIGRKVQLYCNRSPSVHGTVKKVDLRFGKVLVENDEEVVEVALSAISQVRYQK